MTIVAAQGLGSTPAAMQPPQFELCVLEAMLEYVAMELERSFQQVESIAGPGLPALRVRVRLLRAHSADNDVCMSTLPGVSEGSHVGLRTVQVSKTRLDWLRRLRIDIAQLSATVISVRAHTQPLALGAFVGVMHLTAGL